MLKHVKHDVMQSQKLTAKSQSKKETRHKYISFIRVLAKLKYVLLFFCRNQKLKACNEKRSGIIRETLSLKLQGCCGEAKWPLPQKQNKKNAFFDLLLQKMSGQPSANSQNQPLKTPHFASFPKVRKIAQIVSH